MVAGRRPRTDKPQKTISALVDHETHVKWKKRFPRFSLGRCITKWMEWHLEDPDKMGHPKKRF